MAGRSEWGLSEEDGRGAIGRIVEELARRRMSRRHLADLARVSLSTLEKVLSGRRPLTLATLVRIEEALSLPLRRSNGPATAAAAVSGGGIAPDEYGNYSRPAVQWLERGYLTIRPSFGDSKALYAYRTEISWDAQASLLVFREAERSDTAFTQYGSVAVPNQSGYIYFVTNRHGQHRLIIASRPTIAGAMHGILTTLMVGRGAHLMPVATPIVMVPIAPGEPCAFGQIGPGHPAFARYRALLRRTIDDQFAMLLPG